MIDGVHIWRAALDEEGWPGSRELPLEERRRAEEFLRKGAGRRWVAARWALRRTLARYLDSPAARIELEVAEHGKPRLRDGSNGLEFNLTHSGGLALVAVTERRQVGIDVEMIAPRENVLALAERALPAKDVAAIRGADPAGQLDAFYAAWVRHEARVKCLGGGLTAPASAATVSTETIAAAPGYAAAIAVAGPEVGPLDCRTLRAG
jgi:4'-phosphopantetheinyl transferase